MLWNIPKTNKSTNHPANYRSIGVSISSFWDYLSNAVMVELLNFALLIVGAEPLEVIERQNKGSLNPSDFSPAI